MPREFRNLCRLPVLGDETTSLMCGKITKVSEFEEIIRRTLAVDWYYDSRENYLWKFPPSSIQTLSFGRGGI